MLLLELSFAGPLLLVRHEQQQQQMHATSYEAATRLDCRTLRAVDGMRRML